MDYEKLIGCRNKKELETYFIDNGKSIKELNINNLKKSFKNDYFGKNYLNLEQLKSIAGGWEIHIFKNNETTVEGKFQHIPTERVEETPLLPPSSKPSVITTTAPHEQACVPEQGKRAHFDINLDDGRTVRIIDDNKYKFTSFEHSANVEVEKTAEYTGFHHFKEENQELSNQILENLKGREGAIEDRFSGLNSQDNNSMLIFDPHAFYEQAHSRPDGIQLQVKDRNNITNITAKALEVDLNGKKQHYIHLTDDKANQTFYLLTGDTQAVNFEPQCRFFPDGSFSLNDNFVDFFKTLNVGSHQIEFGDKTLTVTHNEDHSLMIEHNGIKEIFIPVQKKFGEEDLHVSLDKDGNIVDFICSSPRNIILDVEKTFFDAGFHLCKFVIEGSKAVGNAAGRELDAIAAFNEQSSMILFSNVEYIKINGKEIEVSNNLANYLSAYINSEGEIINLGGNKSLKIVKKYSETERKTFITVELNLNGKEIHREFEAKEARIQNTETKRLSAEYAVKLNSASVSEESGKCEAKRQERVKSLQKSKIEAMQKFHELRMNYFFVLDKDSNFNAYTDFESDCSTCLGVLNFSEKLNSFFESHTPKLYEDNGLTYVIFFEKSELDFNPDEQLKARIADIVRIGKTKLEERQKQCDTLRQNWCFLDDDIETIETLMAEKEKIEDSIKNGEDLKDDLKKNGKERYLYLLKIRDKLTFLTEKEENFETADTLKEILKNFISFSKKYDLNDEDLKKFKEYLEALKSISKSKEETEKLVDDFQQIKQEEYVEPIDMGFEFASGFNPIQALPQNIEKINRFYVINNGKILMYVDKRPSELNNYMILDTFNVNNSLSDLLKGFPNAFGSREDFTKKIAILKQQSMLFINEDETSLIFSPHGNKPNIPELERIRKLEQAYKTLYIASAEAELDIILEENPKQIGSDTGSKRNDFTESKPVSATEGNLEPDEQQSVDSSIGENGEMQSLLNKKTNNPISKNNDGIHSLVANLIIAGFSISATVGIVLLIMYYPNLFSNNNLPDI